MAEGEGFEPPVRSSRTHDFESRAFNHSATPPWNVSQVGFHVIPFQRDCPHESIDEQSESRSINLIPQLSGGRTLK